MNEWPIYLADFFGNRNVKQNKFNFDASHRPNFN